MVKDTPQINVRIYCRKCGFHGFSRCVQVTNFFPLQGGFLSGFGLCTRSRKMRDLSGALQEWGRVVVMPRKENRMF